MSEELTSKAKLRIEFIGMAFALAVGQVGLEIGEFYSHNLSIRQHPYVFSQLLLGTYIIAASWVGWQESKSIGHLEEVNNAFGKGFLILFVDLFLVVCYFIIVKSVEKPYEENYQATVTSRPEIFWSMVIFSTYAVWDVLSKLFDFDSNNFKIKWHLKNYIQRGYQALICILLVILVNNLQSDQHPWNVVLVDIFLLLVFILFRGLKERIKEPAKHRLVIVLKYAFYRVIPFILILIILINYKYSIVTV